VLANIYRSIIRARERSVARQVAEQLQRIEYRKYSVEEVYDAVLNQKLESLNRV
jgi:hypothetical protein